LKAYASVYESIVNKKMSGKVMRKNTSVVETEQEDGNEIKVI